MAKKRIRIVKESYRNEQVKKLVDTKFNTFTQPVEISDTDLIEELFRIYDQVFLDIPVNGSTNSHEYLIRKSSELYNIDQTTEELQSYLEEIDKLRQQLLQANQRIFDLTNNE